MDGNWSNTLSPVVLMKRSPKACAIDTPPSPFADSRGGPGLVLAHEWGIPRHIDRKDSCELPGYVQWHCPPGADSNTASSRLHSQKEHLSRSAPCYRQRRARQILLEQVE
jgi:hypothetical protein